MADTGDHPVQSTDIAIIGMAARFPGAPNVDTFWNNVRDGVESIVPLDDDALRAAGVSEADLNDPDYVKVCPLLSDVDKFDASFFGFNPREASVMDPAHRVFLEIAWAAFENAGYKALPEDGKVGVFATAGAPDYYVENVRTHPEIMRSMGDFLVRHTGNDMNFLATRVSYEMDLRGPSMNVQTACSSALVALHMAAQSLRQGECDMALIGGATILFPQGQGYMYRDGEILSPDGHCRPFDAKSAGTVFGSGAGALIVKRLDDALDDGDTIHAVVKGSAINNDGALKVGYLAPGVDGQANVIADALKAADVPGESITYIETHGTGTLVGDPIEVEALNEAYGQHTEKTGYCGIGSVKSNIGHLGETAAAASLIKAVMALKHRQMPPSLGFETPNPAMNLEDSPFYVNDRLKDWTAEGPLRCGVTALGAGGTNCHVILEEAPEALPGEDARDKQLLVLSAKTAEALNDASLQLADFLDADADTDLADTAYTLALGRRPMPHRRVVVAANAKEASARLRDPSDKMAATLEAGKDRAKTVFMFPGGGAQYADMGRELYEQDEVYREAVDECLAIITPKLGRDLKPLMYPPADQVEAATRTLEQPSLTLPALFTTTYALAELYESWGLQPDAFIGHSMGEYVAACKAGVFSLEDALTLVMLRGELFECIDQGGMLSVPMSEGDVRALAPESLDIAAVNAPDLCVASGPRDQIDAFQAKLTQQDIDSTPIRIDVAAHSRMLDPILERFRTACRKIAFKAPAMPFVSNLTGKWISPDEACDPEYWVNHLRSTVRFADGLQTLRSLGEPVLVEIGPGRTLSMLAKAQETPFRYAFNTVRHPQESASDLDFALLSFGKIWAAGADVDWDEFYSTQLRNRIPLPTYPFARDSYWVEPRKTAATTSDALVKRPEIKDWFAQLSFREAPLVRTPRADLARNWVIFGHAPKLVAELQNQLGDETVHTVLPGDALHQTSDQAWTINFSDSEQFAQVLEEIEEASGAPDHIIFATQDARRSSRTHEKKQDRLFLQPTYLVQALASRSEPVQLSVLTSRLAQLDNEVCDPYQSLALGPVLTTPRELTHIKTRCIDLPRQTLLKRWTPELLGRLRDELRSEPRESVVALRTTGRWVRTLSPSPIEAADVPSTDWLRENGVYLITGGLSGIGMEVAQHMSALKPVKLALMARKGLPPESEWESILSDPIDSQVAQRIRHVRKLRERGADVMVVAGDVTKADGLSDAIDSIRTELGALNGVIHAAGSMDDAPLMVKDAVSMRRLLAPKVAGSINLDKAITEDLDLFVMFSSVASFLGLPGQVDYTAANAFLDAFARQRTKRAAGRTAVINWNAWRDVGMAEAAQQVQSGGTLPYLPSRSPAWDGYTDVANGRLFIRDLSEASDWILSEHRVKDGNTLLSGTTMLELARAAAADLYPGEKIKLSNLTFLAPFVVPDGETRRLSLHAVRDGNGHAELSIRDGSNLDDMPLVVCDAAKLKTAQPDAIDLHKLAERCKVRTWVSQDGFLDQDFMSFGQRWANMKQVAYGEREALVELQLADEFQADLESGGLHPAILDMATGGVQQLIPGVDLSREFYVPLSYDRVHVYDDMPAHVFSHVRCLPGSGDGLAYFDVTLADASGNVFAEIFRFTMKRLAADEAFASGGAKITAGTNTAQNEALEALLLQGIRPNEGVEAFGRVMSQSGLVQTIVSSVDPDVWLSQLDQDSSAESDDENDDSNFERPQLASDYLQPETPVELDLAATWSDLLGVKKVGTGDDFFDLGGNSLIGVRLFASIRKKHGVSLPLATLFEAPTIAELAAVLAKHGVSGAVQAEKGATVETEIAEWSPLVQLTNGLPGLRGIYAIHGAQGNVMKFKSLADRLPDTRPIYGFQAYGSDAKLTPLESIPEMARRYIEVMRSVQPRGPYTLAGYSGGGIVAYEMAQQLKEIGETVDLLIMFDTIHPHAGEVENRMIDRVRNLPRLHPSVAAETIGTAIRKVPVVGKLMPNFKGDLYQDAELVAASWRVFDAFHVAANAYRPQPYEGQVVIVRAARTNLRYLNLGPSLGWDQHLTRSFIPMTVDANHATIFDEPAIDDMAEQVRRLLMDFSAETEN
ncbi:MAG: SDR family NAD(P)-dependent oxidoreductase [Henriciella sp.]|nr:SDR family NAD(P)-dependent oxidoreductase [Henriciella sp.]